MLYVLNRRNSHFRLEICLLLCSRLIILLRYQKLYSILSLYNLHVVWKLARIWLAINIMHKDRRWGESLCFLCLELLLPVSQQQTWNLWNFLFPITLLEFLTTNGNPTLNHNKDFAVINANRDQFKDVQFTNLKNGISKTSLPTIHLEYIEFPISNPPLSMISGISKTSLSKIYPEYLELPISNPPLFHDF